MSEEKPEPDIIPMNSIRRGDKLYLLVDDVAGYLKILGEDEEIQVQNRLEEAIHELLKLKDVKKS